MAGNRATYENKKNEQLKRLEQLKADKVRVAAKTEQTIAKLKEIDAKLAEFDAAEAPAGK